MADKNVLIKLKNYIKNSDAYVSLDPSIKKQGKYLSRWRLLINFNPEELKSVMWG